MESFEKCLFHTLTVSKPSLADEHFSRNFQRYQPLTERHWGNSGAVAEVCFFCVRELKLHELLELKGDTQ